MPRHQLGRPALGILLLLSSAGAVLVVVARGRSRGRVAVGRDDGQPEGDGLLDAEVGVFLEDDVLSWRRGKFRFHATARVDVTCGVVPDNRDLVFPALRQSVAAAARQGGVSLLAMR